LELSAHRAGERTMAYRLEGKLLEVCTCHNAIQGEFTFVG
jgi:hypothetical protein